MNEPQYARSPPAMFLTLISSHNIFLRVIADALGGDVDAETFELSYNADADDVATALEATSSVLGSVDATRTVSGEHRDKTDS